MFSVAPQRQFRPLLVFPLFLEGGDTTVGQLALVATQAATDAVLTGAEFRNVTLTDVADHRAALLCAG